MLCQFCNLTPAGATVRRGVFESLANITANMAPSAKLEFLRHSLEFLLESIGVEFDARHAEEFATLLEQSAAPDVVTAIAACVRGQAQPVWGPKLDQAIHHAEAMCNAHRSLSIDYDPTGALVDELIHDRENHLRSLDAACHAMLQARFDSWYTSLDAFEKDTVADLTNLLNQLRFTTISSDRRDSHTPTRSVINQTAAPPPPPSVPAADPSAQRHPHISPDPQPPESGLSGEIRRSMDQVVQSTRDTIMHLGKKLGPMVNQAVQDGLRQALPPETHDGPASRTRKKTGASKQAPLESEQNRPAIKRGKHITINTSAKSLYQEAEKMTAEARHSVSPRVQERLLTEAAKKISQAEKIAHVEQIFPPEETVDEDSGEDTDLQDPDNNFLNTMTAGGDSGLISALRTPKDILRPTTWRNIIDSYGYLGHQRILTQLQGFFRDLPQSDLKREAFDGLERWLRDILNGNNRPDDDALHSLHLLIGLLLGHKHRDTSSKSAVDIYLQNIEDQEMPECMQKAATAALAALKMQDKRKGDGGGGGRRRYHKERRNNQSHGYRGRGRGAGHSGTQGITTGPPHTTPTYTAKRGTVSKETQA